MELLAPAPCRAGSSPEVALVGGALWLCFVAVYLLQLRSLRVLMRLATDRSARALVHPTVLLSSLGILCTLVHRLERKASLRAAVSDLIPGSESRLVRCARYNYLSWRGRGLLTVFWNYIRFQLVRHCLPASLLPLPRKKLLVLDLDLTLIHSSLTPTADYDSLVSAKTGTGCQVYYVRYRPFLKQFLTEVSKWYRLAVFTASSKVYAEKIVEGFDERGRIPLVYSRSHCTQLPNDEFTKDLSRIHCVDLRDVILLDDNPQNSISQRDNWLPIEGWRGAPSDRQLLQLLPLLEVLSALDDVRPALQPLP